MAHRHTRDEEERIVAKLRERCREEGGVIIAVKVRPAADCPGIRGALEDGTILVDLRSPPEHGKANRELVVLLAQVLGFPHKAVTLLRGAQSRRKRVRLTSP